MIIPQIPWILWFHDISSPFLWDTYITYMDISIGFDPPKFHGFFRGGEDSPGKVHLRKYLPGLWQTATAQKKMWRNRGFIHVYIILYIPRKAWDIDGIKIGYFTNKWQDNTMARYSLSVDTGKIWALTSEGDVSYEQTWRCLKVWGLNLQ